MSKLSPFDDEDLRSLRQSLLGEPGLFPQADYVRVLVEFVRAARTDPPKGKGEVLRRQALDAYVAMGFELYLTKRARTLDGAFRVLNRRGRQRLKSAEHFRVAWLVAMEMQTGRTVDESCEKIAPLVKLTPAYTKKIYIDQARKFGFGRRKWQ